MRSLSTLVAVVALAGALPAQAGSGPAQPAKLAVLVVFDQLRPAELDRYEPLFQGGGFGGLMHRGGARFDARYRYAVTETGPGHATLATGANPNVHGICANRWLADEGEVAYCAADPSGTVHGAKPDAEKVGPLHLHAPTLGDALKLSTDGAAKVVTVSIKDRAAIFTAGGSADLAIWYDADQGRFTSSAAYVDKLPAWLEDAGRRLPEASMRSGTWTPLELPKRSTATLPDDEQPGEAARYGFTGTFPHHLKDIPDEADRRRAYRVTPQSLSDLVQLGLTAIDEEGLGKDDAPDLLVLAVSTTDFAGHWYGPGSLEYADLLRRADRELRGLVRELDARFGSNGWTMGVAADHGGAPLVERAQRAGRPKASRIAVDPLREKIKAATIEVLGGDGTQVKVHPPNVFLADLKVPADKRADLLARIRAILETEPGVAHVYDPAMFSVDNDPYVSAYRESTFPGRCDALFVRPEIGRYFVWGELTGSDHGTPYGYDARVPLFVVGPGVRRGRYAHDADPRDLAPTLAFLLGVPPPAGSQGTPLPAVGADHVVPILGR